MKIQSQLSVYRQEYEIWVKNLHQCEPNSWENNQLKIYDRQYKGSKEREVEL